MDEMFSIYLGLFFIFSLIFWAVGTVALTIVILLFKSLKG